MPQELRKEFVEDVSIQLEKFYQDLKLKRKMDQKEKYRIEGFMFAGTRLGLINKQELSELMEEIHSNVFDLSIAERRLKNLKNEQEVVDWSFYDTPITKRNKMQGRG